MVETFGTGKIGRGRILELIGEHFDLRPGAFREYLRLHRPIYQKTAAYGHFGRDDPDFTWEQTDKAEALREAAGSVAAAAAPASARSPCRRRNFCSLVDEPLPLGDAGAQRALEMPGLGLLVQVPVGRARPSPAGTRRPPTPR